MKKLELTFFSFWVERYRVSFLIFFLIVVLGVFSLYVIPKESSPDIEFWIISIVTTNQWVNPADMDNLITEKIEKEIENIEWISKITSVSSVGVSSITVELRNDAVTRDILTDIRDRIDRISFPADADDTIIREISTQNELLYEALIYAPIESITTYELFQKARKIQAELAGTNRIKSIDIGGIWADPFWSNSDADGYDIEVRISQVALESLWLSPAQIAQKIQSYNRNTPLWNYQVWEKYYDFRVQGELTDVFQLWEIIISWSWNSLVQLRDIAEISKKYTDSSVRRLGLYERSWYTFLTLSVNKYDGDNIFAVSDQSKTALEDYINSTPWFEDIDILYSNDLAEVIIDDYKNLANTAIQTLVLVFLTIFIFVWLRESIIASIVLPLAFLVTFVVLDLMGLSLNFLTNFSLVLTLWVAIDTIIVVIEGASERQKLWYSRKNAIILAVYDLKKPLISGTATTLVAFLPMIFLPGVIGKFLAYIPITVFSTLLAALVLSLTIAWALYLKLAPQTKRYHTLDSWESTLNQEEKIFLEKQRRWKTLVTHDSYTLRERFLDFLWKHYTRLLYIFLNSRKSRILSVILPFIFLIASFIFLSPKIGFVLFPDTDNAIITIDITWPTGVSEEYLEPFIPQVENTFMGLEELKLYYITISWNSMRVYIELSDPSIREAKKQRSVFEVEEYILADFWSLASEWLRVEARTISNGPPSWSPIGVKVQARWSEYLSDLRSVAEDFKLYAEWLEGARNIVLSSPETPWQFIFELEREKIAFIWLSPDEILNPIRLQLFGTNAGTINSLYEDNEIKVLIDTYRDWVSPQDIQNIRLQTQVGEIRVWDFMTYRFEPALWSITRENGNITISVDWELDSWYLPTDIQPKLIDFAQSYNYPEGISYVAWWENVENAELIQATIRSFFIAVFLIFTILVLQFNSYSQPLIILYSVVLAMLGVNVWLFLTWNPYSMTFWIWFIALTWVVVNDAIILVDRINRNIERMNAAFWASELHLDDYVRSLVQAWESRLQPIIVTTLTTLFWVLPLALQDAFWAWLWFTLIFWLFAGSFMTLFIIPALYYMVYLRKKMNS